MVSRTDQRSFFLDSDNYVTKSMNDRHIANSKSREQAILLVLVICSSMSYCSATNIYFPGGFHDSRYHASLEISRSDYSTTHLNVWTHGYVIMRWSMQTALGHCRSSSGTLWHYLKLYPCTEKAHDCIFHRINDFWILESYKNNMSSSVLTHLEFNL